MRCAYCNKDCYGKFCSPECQIEYDRFEEKAERHKNIFLVSMLAPVLLVIPGLIFDEYVWIFIGLMFLIIGLVLTVLPFGTPETNRALGVQRTVKVLRIAGALIAVVGGLMIVLSILL